MIIDSSKWEKLQKDSFQKRYEPFDSAVKQGNKKGYDFEDFSQDLYSSLYQINPKYPDQVPVGNQWAKDAIDEMRQLPEFKQLREGGTKCDSLQSGLGATILTKHFAKNLPESPKDRKPEEVQSEIDTIKEIAENTKNQRTKKRLGNKVKKAKKELEKSKENWKNLSDQIKTGKIRQAGRKALQKAQKELDDTMETMSAFGYGSEPGDDGFGEDINAKIQIAEKLKKVNKLKKLAKLAGRFKREAARKSSEKKRPGCDEITDIETGDALGRLLPNELVKIKHPLLKKLFFRDYLEKSLMQYRLDEVVEENRGPIVVCIDNSGSMSGEREIWSKAVFMALAQIAMKDKRKIECLHFDTDVRKKYIFEGKIDPNQLIDACSYFSGGGTDYTPVLKQGLYDIIEDAKKSLNKADLILISDGLCDVHPDIEKALLMAKKSVGVKLYTILIGVSTDLNNSYAKKLKELSNYITTLSDLSDDDEVKDTLFSI